MTVRIGLLGNFEVTDHAGTPVDLGSPRQRAVLALLAIDAGKVVPLERIVDRLWGDDPPARAEGTLHAYISNLRRALEPDRPARAPSTVIVSRSPGYLLAVPPESIDAVVFERMVGEGRVLAGSDPEAAGRLLREALTLWRGPALADFTYEAFATAEIARLEESRLDATEARVGADLAAGRSGELVGELERLVAEHPLRERLWGHLMLALYRSGRQADALRAFRRCRELLVEELGIEPGAGLRALEEAILQQDPALQASVPVPAGAASLPPSPPRPVEDAPDLVGRDVEMEVFTQALGDAAAGRGTVLMLEGEPGIGKTRLLEAMYHRADLTGVPAALARCVEVGGTPPFWPWIQLSRGMTVLYGAETLAAAAGPYARYLESVFPDVAAGGTDVSRSGDVVPHRVAEGILAAVRQLTTDRPLVLLVDDIYGADPDSLSVLALVAAEISRLGLVVVCTYRSTAVPADHPLADILGHMARIDRVSRLPLRQLGVKEMAELIHQVTGVDADPGVVEAVHMRSGGNAFFAVELVRLLSAEGNLTVEGSAAAAVPTTVRDVLRQRLARLDEPTVALLRVASVSGRRWDLGVVTAVLGDSADRALDDVDVAVAAGIISEDGTPGSYRFSHLLVGDTIALGLGSLRRAQIHRDLVAVMEARRGNQPTAWSEIAHHAVEAVPISGAEAALAPLARAGRHALESHAHELAERLFDQRYELVRTMPPSVDRDEAEIEVLLDLSLVWILREGYHSPRLVDAGRRLLDLAAGLRDESAPGDDRIVTVVLPAFQGLLSHQVVSGDINATVETATLLDEMASLDPDPAPMTTMAGHLNMMLAAGHSGDASEARRRADAGEALLETLDPGLTGRVMIPLGLQSLACSHFAFAGWARWMSDDMERSRSSIRVARDAADRSGHLFSAAFVAGVESHWVIRDYDAAGARDLLAWARSHEGIEQFPLARAWLEATEAWADGCDGDPEGVTRLRDAIARQAKAGAEVCHTQYLGMVAHLELAAGRPEAALEATQAGIDQVHRRGEGCWYPELERLAALALRALGREREATEALDRGEANARENGMTRLVRRIAETRRS